MTGESQRAIGKDTLMRLFSKPIIITLVCISAVPVPPNPSELIALKKTEELV
jgi:hypothetical protein